MPMHIEQLTSEVAVQDGELPLTPAQIEQLVALVIAQARGRARARRSERAPRPS